MAQRPTDILLEQDEARSAAELLARYRFADPQRAHRNVLAIGEDALVREPLREALPELLEVLSRSADPDMALNNFERYCAATFGLSGFLSMLRADPALIERLATVFSTSQALADTLVRNPEYLELMADPEARGATRGGQEFFEELGRAVSVFDTEAGRMGATRRFCRREMLRIGVRDILGLADLAMTTRELSRLAAACLQVALEVVLGACSSRYGTPVGLETGDPVEFAVIGMGKLGGGELNYSSDIDVLFVYSEEGKAAPPEGFSMQRGALEAEAFFTKVAEQLIRFISAQTDEGHVFRVDARLRPEGAMGPLVRSLASTELYYAQWGAAWERQALIKARPVAGSARLGQRFLETIRPFVYRRHLSYGDIEELRQIKRRADGEVARRGQALTNIKLGRGGIREVEFAAQLLQLLLGGQYPQLQASATLEVLALLGQLGFLAADEATRLSEAYIFLRTVEHRLQLEHAVQTHTLPRDEAGLYRLARRCGLPEEGRDATVSRFRAELKRHVEAVAHTYQGLFEQTRKRLAPKLAAGQDQRVEDAAILLDAQAPPEAATAVAARYGFADAARAVKLLGALAYGPPYSPHSPETTRLFRETAPTLLAMMPEVPDPCGALANLEGFIVAYGARRVLYELLGSNDETLRMLLLLFGTSQFLSDILCRQPDLFDAAARRDVLESSVVNDFRVVFEELQIDALSAEAALPYFIRYRNEELFKIGLRDILRLADVEETMHALSDLARRLARLVLERCQASFEAKYGTPLDDAGRPARFCVLGCGKLGGDEMGYGSDLDVLFVYAGEGKTRGGDRTVVTSQYFNELAAAVLRTMTATTARGSLAKVDARIRPDGEQGPLCPSLEGYARAYRRRIQAWEKQALLRASCVAGDRSLADDFLRMRDDVVFARPLRREELDELRRIRRRMETERVAASARDRDLKLSPGGIVDIEFTAQALQLVHGHTDRSLAVANTPRALRALHEAGHLGRDEYLFLNSTYAFYRIVEHALRIQTNAATDELPADEAELRRLLRALRLFDAEPAAFLERLATHRTRVRSLYERAMGVALAAADA